MSIDESYCPKLSTLFTPENIEIIEENRNIDDITLKLLKNLAVSYGIGNVSNIFESFCNSQLHNNPIRISNHTLAFSFRLGTITRVQLAIAVSANGIDTGLKEKRSDIHVLIVIAAPKNRPDLSLKAEMAVRAVFNNKAILNSILSCNNKLCIWRAIADINELLPQFIKAGDIMTEALHVLNETNTLFDAVNLFISSKQLHIPVVDVENELIGEVNANELMKVCLPRYILWLDDIKPIVNFEPFYNMLEHEENTWLTEIMTHDIAMVQYEDYAMQAGIAMVKKDVQYAYVLNNRKLVGIITMEHFLNKILRK